MTASASTSEKPARHGCLPFIIARVPGLLTNSGQENNGSSLEFITESVDSIYQAEADCRARRKRQQRRRKPYDQFVVRWLRFHGHSNDRRTSDFDSMKRKELLSFKPEPSPYVYPALGAYAVTTAYPSEASSDADNQHACL